MHVATSETEAAWNEFFADLVAGGLAGVRLVTREANVGLPGTTWRRRRTHYATNQVATTPKSIWPPVKAMLHLVYVQPDAKAMDAQFDRFLDYVGEKPPVVAEHLGRTSWPSPRSRRTSGPSPDPIQQPHQAV